MSAEHHTRIAALEQENESLRAQLREALEIVTSIREGHVDALVVNDPSGKAQIFAIESADYTYRILIEKFAEGALSVTQAGLVLYANSYFAALVGVPGSEIPGTDIRNYLAEPSLWDDLVSDGMQKRETALKTPQATVPVYLSVTDLNPTVAAIGVVVTDLSEKKKQESDLLDYQEKLEANIAELYNSNGNLEQVIHVLSHDLKEPLRKILTYISQLKHYSETDFSEKDRKWLGIVDKSAARLNALLDDVVKYAFISSEEQPYPVDLNAMLGEVTDDLEIMIAETAFSYESSLLPTLMSTDVQMRQLLSNIFSNAIKYRKRSERPKLRIAYEPMSDKPGFCRISMTDNGIGMQSENIGQIFTVFRRLHHRHEYSGNGIGLAICKKIMENHRGAIEVSSRLGEGSTFSVYFPQELVVAG
jgi:signal transduction histidine kinase